MSREQRELQRYTCVADGYSMEKDGDGEFVRFSDVAPFAAELRAQAKTHALIEAQWGDACGIGQQYCLKHGVGVPGESVFEAMRDDAERLRAQLAAAEAEEEASSALVARQGALLTGVVNAIRGEPAPLSMHSHHDAVELVLALRTRAKRAEVVTEAARAFLATPEGYDDKEVFALAKALEAYDATPSTPTGQGASNG